MRCPWTSRPRSTKKLKRTNVCLPIYIVGGGLTYFFFFFFSSTWKLYLTLTARKIKIKKKKERERESKSFCNEMTRKRGAEKILPRITIQRFSTGTARLRPKNVWKKGKKQIYFICETNCLLKRVPKDVKIEEREIMKDKDRTKCWLIIKNRNRYLDFCRIKIKDHKISFNN